MPYVMVPVPEEHVEEVMQFVLQAVARAAITPWDDESVTRVFSEVDEASRSLLAFVARSVLAGKDLSEAELAAMMQLNPRETAGIHNELITLSRSENRPNLVTSRGVSERLPNGRTVDKRVFLMDDDIAEMVQAAEKADLMNVPHPLEGPPG